MTRRRTGDSFPLPEARSNMLSRSAHAEADQADKAAPGSIEVKVIGGKIYIHAEGSSDDL